MKSHKFSSFFSSNWMTSNDLSSSSLNISYFWLILLLKFSFKFFYSVIIVFNNVGVLLVYCNGFYFLINICLFLQFTRFIYFFNSLLNSFQIFISLGLLIKFLLVSFNSIIFFLFIQDSYCHSLVFESLRVQASLPVFSGWFYQAKSFHSKSVKRFQVDHMVISMGSLLLDFLDDLVLA